MVYLVLIIMICASGLGCATKIVAKNCMVSVDKENNPQDYFVCEKE